MSEAFADYAGYDACGLGALIASGAVKPVDVVAAAIDRIEHVNPKINAVTAMEFDRALEMARTIPPAGPFGGVPFLLKDLIVVEGEPVTFGSAFFRNYTADFTHELVSRFRHAGLISLGRTNTPEFGLLPTTEPVLHGPTRNPWNLDYSAGGSSGGAAAAVAAGMVPMAHASDGGGSIRIPASACGVFGLKPSRGRMPQRPRSSNDGLVAPLAVSRSVRDSATLLDVTAGPVPGDLWWAPPPVGSFRAAAEVEPPQLRCAFTVHDFRDVRVHPDCEAAVMTTVSALEALGHHVVETRPIIDADAMSSAFLAVWASFADAIFQLILAEVDTRRLGRIMHRALGDWATMRLIAAVDARKSGLAAFEPFTWDLARRSRRLSPGGFRARSGHSAGRAYEMARFLG